MAKSQSFKLNELRMKQGAAWSPDLILRAHGMPIPNSEPGNGMAIIINGMPGGPRVVAGKKPATEKSS